MYGAVTLDNENMVIQYNDRQNEIENEAPYEKLKAFIDQYKAEIEDKDLAQLPFVSGFVGSCSFDLVRHEFPVLKQIDLADHKQHDAKFYMVEDVYVFDHYKEHLYVISTNLFSNESEEQLARRVKRHVDELQDVNIYPAPIKMTQKQKQLSQILLLINLKTVSEMKSLIQQGDMFQVVPSIIYKYKHDFGMNLQQLSYQLYQNLKRQNPSPYMYYLNFDEPIIVGSSPESFVKVKGQNVVTNPIAGTIKRGTTTKKILKMKNS